MTTSPAAIQAFRAELVDFSDDPRQSAKALRHIPDGLLLVREGKVLEAAPAETLLPGLGPEVQMTDWRGHIITPGFIDAHVHYPQTGVIASHGKQLLDWLNDYTFPAEAAFADPVHAGAVADFFLDELLRNGTTTAAVYATVHPASVEAFFERADARHLRMLCGKVLMDRNCPADLRDDASSAYADSARLISRWHGHHRLLYAVTPRFAATSTEEQLQRAGQLLQEHPSVYLQTHIAENHGEIRWVAELFPWSQRYLDVYARFGLLTSGALYGHCIHFDAEDWNRFADSGAVAVHCPTSNLFLGSGLFDYDAALSAGARVALATDVGGGTSFSMLRTMHEAYKVAQLGGHAFDSLDAFYLATLGGARALHMADRIGRFAPGSEADFIVLDPNATPLLARRMAGGSLSERLFVLMMLGDERAVAATYVLGQPAARRL